MAPFKFRKNKKKEEDTSQSGNISVSSQSTTASNSSYNYQPMYPKPSTSPKQVQHQQQQQHQQVQQPSQVPPKSTPNINGYKVPQTPNPNATPSPQLHYTPYNQSYNIVPTKKATPWKRYNLLNSPFPRYRHAASSISSEKNDIFIMGGLKDGSVFGDTWVISPTISPISPNPENYAYKCRAIEINNNNNPPERVGHSSVLCGNAFIIFGGDTVDTDANGYPDDNFYLFNTNNSRYTLPNHIHNKPKGRYGHTIGVIAFTTSSSRLYLFGGQLENTSFNDMYYFELTSFKSPNATWEKVTPSSNTLPPPLTNHSMVVHKNKLYIFGGVASSTAATNETWCFDPAINKWSLVATTGAIPPPINEHAAVVVSDNMFVHGGNDFNGNLYEDMYVLNLRTKHWTKLPRLIGAPGSRCGHSMSFISGLKKIVILGGDKMDFVGENGDVSEVDCGLGTIVYELDLSKVEYFLGVETSTPVSSPGKTLPTTPDSVNGVKARELKFENESFPNQMTDATPKLISNIHGEYPVKVASNIDDYDQSTHSIQKDKSLISSHSSSSQSTQTHSNFDKSITSPPSTQNTNTAPNSEDAYHKYVEVPETNVPITNNVIQASKSASKFIEKDQTSVPEHFHSNSLPAETYNYPMDGNSGIIAGESEKYNTVTKVPSFVNGKSSNLATYDNPTEEILKPAHKLTPYRSDEELYDVRPQSSTSREISITDSETATGSLPGSLPDGYPESVPESAPESITDSLATETVAESTSRGHGAHASFLDNYTYRDSQVEFDGMGKGSSSSLTPSSSAGQGTNVTNTSGVAATSASAASTTSSDSGQIKQMVISITNELNTLRLSAREQMLIASEKISKLEEEKNVLSRSHNDDIRRLNEEIAIKERIIDELKSNQKVIDERELLSSTREAGPIDVDALDISTHPSHLEALKDLNTHKRINLEVNSQLTILENENKELKAKLEEFEPFMDNQIIELEELNSIIKTQNEKIDSLHKNVRAAEELEKEINYWKHKHDDLLIEHNNFKMINGENEDESDISISHSTLNLSNSLDKIIEIWQTKKNGDSSVDRGISSDEKTVPLVNKLQSQIGELLNINKMQENLHEKTVEESNNLKKTITQQNEKITKLSNLKKYEDNYRDAIQSVKNTSKALNLTQIELTKQKDINKNLQKEIDELKLYRASRRASSRTHTPLINNIPENQNSDDDTGKSDDEDDIKSAHYNMKIRDLQADLIIIKQERDQLKEDFIGLKKQMLRSKSEDDY